MSKTQKAELEETKRLMSALGRMKPKPHKEMKLGKAVKKQQKRKKQEKQKDGL